MAERCINYEDFIKLDIRIGTVLSVDVNKKARMAAYILEIDFGPLGIKKSSAQITKNYALKDLIGKKVVAVVNFPPKRIAGFNSEVLVLGASEGDDDIYLLTVEEDVKNGSKIM